MMSVESLLGLFVTYGYWIVFAAILLDNAGLPVPGELFLLALGGFAGRGDLDPFAGVAIAAAAGLAGDNLGYWAGRFGCDRFFRALAWSRPRVSPGQLGVVLGRFVVGARVLVAPLAGCSRMSFPRFLVLDALGCTTWAGVFILLGYAAVA